MCRRGIREREREEEEKKREKEGERGGGGRGKYGGGCYLTPDADSSISRL